MTTIEQLDRVKNASGTKAKEALIKSYFNDDTFRKACWYAYNPQLTFGITSKNITAQGNEASNELFPSNLLDKLAQRELTGNEAIESINSMLTWVHPHSVELVKRVLDKDLDAGFASSTLNKIKKGFVPVFKPMLANKFEEKKIKKFPVYTQEKLDGMRVLVDYTAENGVQFLSRSGKIITSLDHLKDEMLQLFQGSDERVIFDAEVVAKDFNTTVSQVRRKDKWAKEAELYLFDVIPRDEFYNGESYDTCFTRYTVLGNLVDKVFTERVHLLPSRLSNSFDEVYRHNDEVLAKGGEGVIIKPVDGTYQAKRSNNWLKIKQEQSVDVKVTGYFEGTGKYQSMLGGLVVDNGGVSVRVGGGFSDDQRRTFWKERESLEGRLIEVEYHETTKDGSLRHPRFKRFRDAITGAKE